MPQMPVLTKSQQVERYLRSSILRGAWAPGQRLPGEREITAKLGTSATPVREALKVLASEGLIERKQGSGTFVTQAVQKGHVKIVVPRKSVSAAGGYYYRRVMDEAERRILATGYLPEIVTWGARTREEAVAESHLLDSHVSRRTLGVLAAMDLGFLEDRFAKLGTSCVSIAGTGTTCKHAVVLDHETMTALGGKLLKSRGHEDFVLMYPVLPSERDGHTSPERKKLSDMRLAAVDYCEGRLVGVPWSWDLKDTYAFLRRYWSAPDRPRAVFFFDDNVCDVATRVFLEYGIKVPDDLAIVTHSNAGREFQFPVALTCIEFGLVEAVAAAWKMLEKLINSDAVDEPLVYVRPQVREGESL